MIPTGTLVLARPRRAGFFRAQAPLATIVTEVAALEKMQGCFEAAIVDGLLDDEPWDRWALQCVHRLLRMDAQVTVVVAPLASLASALDLPFAAYAARQAARHALMPRIPGLELPGPTRRRYRLARLAQKLESVGFTAIQPGAGWNRRGAWSWLARRATLTARKASSLPGLRGRAWPEADAHRRLHAARHGEFQAAQDAWLSTCPGFAGAASRELDPAEWREARVLVLAPHPDDELIGCGGTLCRLVAAGAQVSIVQATDGGKLESLRDLPPAERRTVRLEEAALVAAALGARLELWREEDSRLRCSEAAIARLAGLLAELRPTHVFTPFLGDLHADHRALSRMLARALARSGEDPLVLQYEVWGTVPANLHCDVTAQAETLERLLLLYTRAMRVDDFVYFCASRNLARAFELSGAPGYVEAFLATPSSAYARAAEQCAM